MQSLYVSGQKSASHILCILTAGFYLGFFVWGRESILKNFGGHAAARKIFFRPSRESGGGHATPENFEKIAFRIG